MQELTSSIVQVLPSLNSASGHRSAGLSQGRNVGASHSLMRAQMASKYWRQIVVSVVALGSEG
jgi:hypothetical protein